MEVRGRVNGLRDFEKSLAAGGISVRQARSSLAVGLCIGQWFAIVKVDKAARSSLLR